MMTTHLGSGWYLVSRSVILHLANPTNQNDQIEVECNSAMTVFRQNKQTGQTRAYAIFPRTALHEMGYLQPTTTLN